MEFGHELGKLGPDGSSCPANERTLCQFATHLPQSVQYATIEVYLSAGRVLHIEQGPPDPLANCLHLQRVLQGIRCSHGDSKTVCHPATDHTLLLVFKFLDLSIPDHCMLWAACNLAYFGFLSSSEFTVQRLSSFSS